MHIYKEKSKVVCSPDVKNSSSKSPSIPGRSDGSDFSSFAIRFLAQGLTREGIWYSFFLMRVYVSFKQEVSNGGLPTSNVYLKEINTKIMITIYWIIMLDHY